ncbi:MAG TPA: site-2 protease family protein, partial [Acidimicrobiales bacterium]
MSETELIPPTPEGPIAADQEPEGDIAGVLGLVGLVGALVALGLFGGWPILAVVVSLIVMIFMHELGHYITAKRAGMKVTEFFIGFGPRIWSFQRGETEYGVKAIPAGAYVRIIGMNSLEEVDPADESRTYRQKSYPRRMSVAVAGSAMHFLMA